MIKALIIYLIRRRLHLRKGEKFRFVNQKTECVYYFTAKSLMKYPSDNGLISKREKSFVSLNYLLSDDCEVEKV